MTDNSSNITTTNNCSSSSSICSNNYENNNDDIQDDDFEQQQSTSTTTSITTTNDNSIISSSNNNNNSIIPQQYRKVVKIVSNEGDEYDLEDCVIEMCRTVKYIASGKVGFRNGLGGWFNIEGKYVLHKKEGRLLATIYSNTDQECILCFPEIRGQILSAIIDYCKFHSSNPTPTQIVEHDENLITMKQPNLCELASASYYLDVKSLVSLTSREIAAQISQKSSEEIRETFTNLHLAGYQYVPAHNKSQKKKKEKQIPSIQPVQPLVDDNRTVDELLEFLGEDHSQKKKKKNKKPKQPALPTIQPQPTLQQNQTPQIQTTTPTTPTTTTSTQQNQKINQTISTTAKSDIIKPNSVNTSHSSSSALSPNLISTIASNSSPNSVSPLISGANNNNNIGGSNSNKGSMKSSQSSPDLFSTTNHQKMYSSIENEDDDELDPDLQEEIDKEVESFKQRLDMFSRSQSKQKLTLPSRTLAALLDAY